MHPRQRFLITCLTLLGLCAFAQTAVAIDIPLANWEVPQHELSKAGVSVEYYAFTPIQPCRLVDTRPASGFPAAWGPPALLANATRDFDLDSAPHCPGLPSGGVRAYSINITVAEVTGPGDIRVWPRDDPPAVPTSVQNWTQGGPAFAMANAMIVAAGTDGKVTVQMAGSSGHVLIDINGYFAPLDPSGQFRFSSSIDAAAAVIVNFGFGPAVHGSSSNSYGVWGQSRAIDAVGAAVRGELLHTGPLGNGVWGSHSGTGNGVYGTTGPGGHAGVYGVAGSGGVGVRGSGSGSFGYGVFVEGALGTTGTKQFVEPHPTDPALAIRFVSLEGPEAGTYFRGRSKFSGGLATIAVPETFRTVTAEEGLSIQVTPIGEMATFAVVRIDLNEIVVKASRNVEFFYTVNGVRRSFKDWNVIGSSDQVFRPRTPEDLMPDHLSSDQRERLIANGTYNRDGSVNLETAKRLGWDKDWDKPTGSPKD